MLLTRFETVKYFHQIVSKTARGIPDANMDDIGAHTLHCVDLERRWNSLGNRIGAHLAQLALAAELAQIELVDPFHEVVQRLWVGGEEARFVQRQLEKTLATIRIER